MNTRYFTSRLLALMLAALLVFSCAAAEETEIPSGVVDNFVQSEIEKQQSASDATAFEAGAAAGEYYADFTFGGVQTLSGITTTLSLYANLPKYAKPVMYKNMNAVQAHDPVSLLQTAKVDYVFVTDATGRFRLELADEVRPEDVKPRCSREGFPPGRIIKRPPPGGALTPVQVDCVLER